MIQANELRINNWVEYEGNYYQILAVDSLKSYKEWEGDVHIKEIVNGVHISYAGRWLNFINPIQITPEILESAGFEKREDDLGDFEFCFEDSLGNRIDKENGIYKYWYGERYAGYVELKYLHQLQNTYPVFNDWKELTINLHATV